MKFSTKIVSSFLAATLISSASCLTFSAADTPHLNKTNVTLYGFDIAYENVLQLPSDFYKEFKFEVVGTNSTPVWRVDSGSYYISINDEGVVTPNYTTYYWYGNIGYSQPIAGQEPTDVTKSLRVGTGRISATVDGKKLYADVEVKDYSTYYVEKVMNEFVAKNIKSTMTEYEKLDAICKFVASYDYDYHYSSKKGMIIFGGGDCWASTDLVNALCEKVGIDAHTRYAKNDPLAGSGHMNSVAYIDGKVYVAEAGYAYTAPRYYQITELENGCSYKTYDSTGLSMYQYDGKSSNLDIPATYNGKNVVNIGKNFMYYNQSYGNNYVEQLSIPSTVKSISDFAFADAPKLLNIKVDSKNTSYTDINGVLFNKNKTNLIAYPNGRTGDYVLPRDTKSINSYSFYYSKNLTSVTAPKGLTTIGEGAFGECKSLNRVILSNTVTSISSFAFYNTKNDIEVLIPSKNITLSDNILNSNSAKIYGYANTPVQTYANTNSIEFVDISKYPVGDANLDGVVNIKDTTYIQKYCAEYLSEEDVNIMNQYFMDNDYDGHVNIQDATRVQKASIHLITL